MTRTKQTVEVLRDRDEAVLDIRGRRVKLTNLRKVFWPEQGFTKGDLSSVLRRHGACPVP